MNTVDISIISILSGVTLVFGLANLAIPIPTALFLCYTLKSFKDHIIPAIVLGKVIKFFFLFIFLGDLMIFAYYCLMVLDDLVLLYAIKQVDFDFKYKNVFGACLVYGIPSAIVMTTIIGGMVIGSFLFTFLLVMMMLPLNMCLNALGYITLFKALQPKMDELSDKFSLFEDKFTSEVKIEELTVVPLVF